MISRIKALIKIKAKSVREFAELIGIKQVTLNQQLVGDRKLSLDVIQSILNSFEDISVEWLLLGQGPMYKSENTTQVPSQAEENISGKSALNVLIKTIEYYQKEVERLMENINELTRENEMMKIELERKKAAGE